MSSSADVLLQPVRIGSLDLPNRVVMAPMTRRCADADNVPSPLAATYDAQRASAGLIVSEACLVSADDAGHPGSPGPYSRAQQHDWPGLADLHVSDPATFYGGGAAGYTDYPVASPA